MNNESTPHNIKQWLLLAGALVVCDQVSKVLVTAFLQFGDVIALAPGINFRLVYNTGAAFSLLATSGDWARWFLLVLAVVICIFLIAWLRRLPAEEKRASLGISLILGGAVGNIIDRVHLGYVIDFVDVYYGEHHWPTFNVADSAITVGAIVIIASLWSK